MTPHKRDPLAIALEEAVILLQKWAASHALGGDPSEIITDAAELWGKDETMVVLIEDHLWAEWASIQDERELMNEVDEDDVMNELDDDLD